MFVGERPVERYGEKSVDSTSLVVDHIPPALNNIAALNDYFSKFGVIINVQVYQQLLSVID